MVNDRMRGSRQELPKRSVRNGWLIRVGAVGAAYMRKLNGLGALVNDESAHAASSRLSCALSSCLRVPPTLHAGKGQE